MSEIPLPGGAGLSSGKYRTLFELGQGGTARLSLVVGGPRLEELFVIKQLRNLYAQDPDFRAMFMTEGRLSARLNHPNVVRVHEVLEDETPAIVMEYIEGQTLDAVLALGHPKLPLELHLRVLADVLGGLHYSHELLDHDQSPLEVVHRDVSPHNVMISYEGVVKVLDFGIAQLAGTAVETETGVVKGKLRYMPPEQVAGEKVDRRADVFAVGVMLWEALSGAPLWRGLPDPAIMNRVLSGAIPEPRNERAPIPPELLEICRRALAPRRSDRYRTALELERALEGYLASRGAPSSSRELSRFMSERFAESRAELARRLEVERARTALDGAPPERGRTRRETPAPRSRLWLFALGSLLLGALIFAWGVRSKAGPSSPGAAAASSPEDSVASRAQQEPTALRVVSPKRLPTSPSADTKPSAAPGAPALAPPTAPRHHAPGVPSASAAPPVAAPSAAEEASCEPPYYYSGGIKQFKPDCL